MRRAPLAITEEAQRLIRATAADFSALTPPAPSSRGRHGGSSTFGLYDFDQVRNQSVYLRLVSIVEAYVDTCSSHLFDSRTSGRDAFVRALVNEVRDASLRGWEERKAAFKTYHGVTLGECSKWSDIDAAREVRNSIAHGLGTLTPRQQGGAVRRKMGAVGIAFRGDQILIDRSAIDRCARSSVAFIQDIDRRL